MTTPTGTAPHDPNVSVRWRGVAAAMFAIA